MFVAHFHLTLPFDVRTCGWHGAVSSLLHPGQCTPVPLSGVPNTALPAQPPPSLPPPWRALCSVPSVPSRVPAGTTGSFPVMRSSQVCHQRLLMKRSAAEPPLQGWSLVPPLPWQQNLLGPPRALREHGCSSGGGSGCRRGNPASKFLALDSPNSPSEPGPAEPRLWGCGQRW